MPGHHQEQTPFPVEPRGGRKPSISTRFFLGSDTDYTRKVQICDKTPGKKLRFETQSLTSDSTESNNLKLRRTSQNRRGSMFMRRRSSLTALLATPPPGMQWMSLEVWKCIKWLVAWTLYCIIGASIFIFLEVQEKDVEVPHEHWKRFKELLTKQEERETLIDLKKNLMLMCDHTFLNQSFSFELSDDDGLPVWRDWDADPKENLTEISHEQESLFADLKDVETACRESLFVAERIISYDTAPSMIDAMYYTMTAITTIGYGHICPSTTANKIFCVLYCLIGVPLTCIFLNNFAESLSIKMLHTYKRAVCYQCQFPDLSDIKGSTSECIHEDDRKYHSKKKVSLLYLITAFFLGMGFIVFMFIPSIALMFIEGWTYLDSFYFTFITLSTIGFGDFVAGYGKNHESGWGTVYKLVLILWIIMALGYWVLVLKFVTKALKKTTRKLTKSFSTRVVTDQATFFKHLVQKVKYHNDEIMKTQSQHNMMELMNEVEGALKGKDKKSQPHRARSISQVTRGQRPPFINGNAAHKFLSESGYMSFLESVFRRESLTRESSMLHGMEGWCWVIAEEMEDNKRKQHEKIKRQKSTEKTIDQMKIKRQKSTDKTIDQIKKTTDQDGIFKMEEKKMDGRAGCVLRDECGDAGDVGDEGLEMEGGYIEPEMIDTDNTSGFTEATEEEEPDLPLSLIELLGVNVVVKSDNVNVMKNVISQVAKEDEGLPEVDKTPEEVTLPLRDVLNLVILISTIEEQMNNHDSMDATSLQSTNASNSTWSVLTKDNPRDSLPLLKDMFLNGRPRLHQLRE